MVRPGRERLRGAIEVDEAYWGAPEEGAVGRLTEDKALIAVAVEEDRDGTEHVIFLSRAGAFTKLSGASGDRYQFFADAKRGTGNGRFYALASLPRHRATINQSVNIPTFFS